MGIDIRRALACQTRLVDMVLTDAVERLSSSTRTWPDCLGEAGGSAAAISRRCFRSLQGSATNLSSHQVKINILYFEVNKIL